MSSESDEYREPRIRRQSSTPDTSRKRRRLASTDSSRRRNHKEFRRYDVDDHYNDDYRVLFNQHVALAASRFDVADPVRHFSEQIGSSEWTGTEQAVFFAALQRLGRGDLPGIAGAIGTKSEAETRDFLLSLQDAATTRGDTKLTLRDVPAAIEIGDECDQQLEQVADALAQYQERVEAYQEQERYGNYWLITPQIAEEIEDAINGVSRPRSTSVSQRPHSRSESRVDAAVTAGACIACKKQKRRCDREQPCGRCSLRNIACVYSENDRDVEQVKHASADVSRPSSASGPQGSEADHSGIAFAGACLACKNTKLKCDRGTPCSRCALLRIECEYTKWVGSGFAGACEWCRKRKKKCDRKMPCTNCMYIKTDCVYPESALQTIGPVPAPEPIHGVAQDEQVLMGNAVKAPILQAIQEANLLRPEAMLKLSKDVFMNRSPEFPSPWAHWSKYSSELATEPSIYRTAFTDFHRLVVSVTKRLVQTTLMQTTSRLRAQRLRIKNGLQPFVKKRDVYAAIDVLGMQRNGNDRWKGVSRRCGLKVLTSTTTSRGKRLEVVPWAKVERMMSSRAAPNEPPATDADSSVDSSVEPEHFKSRAARSGTPLPMQNLTLSDSEDGFEPDALSDDVVDESMEHREQRLRGHNTVRTRDLIGRYTSIPPGGEADDTQEKLRTLEDFDQEAGRQEELALWGLLGMKPAVHDGLKDTDDDLKDADTEKLTTVRDDWQDTVQYRAPWEAYSKPFSAAKFLSNRKSLSPMPATHADRSYGSRSLSGNISDGSSTSGARRPRRKSPATIELRARGTTAYAALQGEDPGGSNQDDVSSSSNEADEDDELLEQDIPTQSIEAENDISDYERSNG